MNVHKNLEKLKSLAQTEEVLRVRLLATRDNGGLVEFCRIAGEYGVSISAMDIIDAGEEAYAAMRRSTNGGGENSPLLQGEDDLYEMFLVELERRLYNT